MPRGRAPFRLALGIREFVLILSVVLLGSCASSSDPGSSEVPELVYFEGSPGDPGFTRIVLVRADGTGRGVLLAEPPADVLNLEDGQFTPEGDALLFFRYRFLAPAPPEWGWWLLPLDGGPPQPFATPNGAFFPRFAPSGNLVAWRMQSGGLGVAPRGSATLLPVTPDTMQAWDFDWSPDGTRLVVALQTDQQRYPDLFLVNLAGGEPVGLGTDGSSEETRPLWSPNGALIAYVRYDSVDCMSNCGLWVAAPDGTGSRLVRGGEISEHVWMSDSRHLLVKDATLPGQVRRGLLDVSTGDFSELDLSGDLVEWPVSPDERYLLLTALSSSNRQAVFVSSIDGGERRQIHPDSLVGSNPAWRP